MQTRKDIVIVQGARTPIGQFLGSLSHYTAPELAAHTIKHCLEKAHLKAKDVTHVALGCVLPAGVGQAPARQAALLAELPHTTSCVTINKVCGSGMWTVMLAHDLLQVHPEQIWLCGGMESMSQAPYLLPKARSGYKYGHQQAIDHMLLDGLHDANLVDKPVMGKLAERCASHYSFSREQQDAYTLASLTQASASNEAGHLAWEIAPMGDVKEDEGIASVRPEKLPTLKPAFCKDGTITAGNASSLADGACSLLIMTADQAAKKDLAPIAKIHAHSTHSQEPEWFTTAPVEAVRDTLKHSQWSVEDVDLFEVNEAFAVVPMAVAKEIGIPAEKLNVHGGACTLGHPLGASGARIILSLINSLRVRGLKTGIATACIGGGEAVAIALECLL